MAFLGKPDEDVIGTITSDSGKVDIVLERLDREKDGPIWLFSTQTLDTVPRLYQELNTASVIPAFLVETQIATVPLFEWLAVLVGMPLLYFFTVLLNRLLSPLAGAALRTVRKRADLSHPVVLPQPVRLLILALVIQWAMSKIALPLLAREFWSTTAIVITIAACVWIVILLNGLEEKFLRLRLVRLNRSGATSILRLGRRTLDLIVLCAGVLVGLHYLGVNAIGVLAGLGVGGIAIALAAQKTLENVIGGISVVFDHTVRVGEMVKVADKQGTVEEIGLRSTRIRTLDRTIVSVPNGQLANVILENLSTRDKYWFHHTLSLRYDTSAAMMRTILDGIDKLIAQHPRAEGGSVQVHFVHAGQSSMDVEIIAYLLSTDWNNFLKNQQNLLLDILETVQAAGAQLAYPSQTLYLARLKASAAETADGAQHSPALEAGAHLQDVR